MASSLNAAERPRAAFLLAGMGILPRLLLICGALLLLLLAAMVYAASVGSTSIPYRDVAESLLQYVGLHHSLDAGSATYRIVTVVRLPGLMVAALVGAALACAGAVMQGLFRNPLADPGIIGISAGASFSVVLVMTQAAAGDLWLLTSGPLSNALWRVPLAAFVGAWLAALLVYGLSLQQGRTNLAALLLAGVALNSVLGALTSVLLLRTSDAGAARSVLSWVVGSLEGRGWAYFRIAVWPILISAVLLLLYSRELNLLTIGEESAQSLGVNVSRVRLILLALSSLLTASAVSVAGTIAFVGLVVPHILRLIIGPDHRVLLPASLIGGAAFLVFADALARSIIAPETLPVGTVTALVGGPFFVFLLWRNRRRIAML
ncbi:MAG TPA: iron ABC transporter permease [Aggregatilinea sp.]|uniref:FecCD family ABC transporter permease n=1 Tax=Aggregatilinea sp. TaxID=2806333 RepID=UPI002B9D7D4A|nr:iron ABC transporter permease [Aggregatilinea sp.]HML24887.1 iron ABC transporter permease [Aggregatilinea sp.]